MGMHERRNVKILIELHQEVKIRAAKKRISMQEIFNEIVKEWIIKEDRELDKERE